ncbi:MAG: hypothetical protein R6U20_03035 [Longimonas sp.]|uniref:hypothetical protein n=1 Tax=Longimonas sp. TaxID=2039626 RepID=UPI003976D48E
MTDILMWASMAMLLVACMAAGGEARALPTDSLQINVHAASTDSIDGWTRLCPDELPAGSPTDTLWISPETVALTPEAWERLTFRLENHRPTLTVAPGPNEQAALRTLLTDTDGQHLVVMLNGTPRFAGQVLSIEGTARSLKLIALPSDEAAQMVEQWQQAHRSTNTDS